MKTDDTNPFVLEDLIIPEATTNAKASPKAGPKAKRKREERFIMITETQAHRLGGASVVVAVFVELMFKGLSARSSSFVLRPDALDGIGIDRHTQSYALRDLAKRGLIAVERRHGRRKPPTITLIGMRQTKGTRPI